MEKSMVGPQQISRITTGCSNFTCVYTQKNWEQGFPTVVGIAMFKAALFTATKTQKQPKRPLTDQWMNKAESKHTMNIFSLKNKGNSESIWYNMNKPWDMILNKPVSHTHKSAAWFHSGDT